MKSLFEYNKTKLIVSIIVLILAIIILLPLMANAFKAVIDQDITPDKSFGYSLDDLAKIKQLYGRAGANTYFITRLTYDLIWPIVYLFFLINTFAFLLNGLTGKAVKVIKLLPFIAVGFDLMENVLCSVYFFYGQKLIGQLAVLSSQIKWYSLILIALLFVLFAIFKIYRYCRYQ